jgi:hypothetical protein
MSEMTSDEIVRRIGYTNQEGELISTMETAPVSFERLKLLSLRRGSSNCAPVPFHKLRQVDEVIRELEVNRILKEGDVSEHIQDVNSRSLPVTSGDEAPSSSMKKIPFAATLQYDRIEDVAHMIHGIVKSLSKPERKQSRQHISECGDVAASGDQPQPEPQTDWAHLLSQEEIERNQLEKLMEISNWRRNLMQMAASHYASDFPRPSSVINDKLSAGSSVLVPGTPAVGRSIGAGGRTAFSDSEMELLELL